MKKHLSIIMVFLSLIGCKSEEDKFVQSKIDEVVGIWQIDDFALGGATEDQRKVLSTGTVQFANCVYNAKSFATGSVGCGGTAELNSLYFFWGYKYNSTTRYYNLTLSETTEYLKNNQKYGTQSATIQNLMRGDWNIIVNGDKMTARQVKNTSGSTVQVSFTATRKQ